MRNFYSNDNLSCLATLYSEKRCRCKFLFVIFFFFSIPVFSQSNHTVSFTNAASDFNALEKISAASGGTDFYITFDQNNLYIGAFRAAGFAATDNLTIYIDTDPQAVSTSGNGSSTGKLYNGVTATLPFKADFNVYAEEAVQQANNFSGGSWIAAIGPSYSTGANSREVKIPFAGMGNPYALNLTMWIGNAGSIYSNVPGVNIASSAAPSIVDYFGTFGIKNGAQGNVNPVNVVTSPAIGYLSGATSIAGGVYAYVDITANATINGLTLAPGGVINVEAGKTLTSTGTINNTAILNNLKSTQINVSGTYTLTGRANCSLFNVNNGGTYNHNSAGSVADGVASDWPGIDARTYGATSNVNILQWATTGATLPIGIPAPTSGGWGNVIINVSQTYGGNWNQKGAFNNIAGNFTLNKLGTNLTPTPAKSFTFNQQLPGATINIGGNFNFSAGSNNNVFLCEPSNPGPSGVATHTMNVHGDFIVSSGHLKFAYHYATVVINSWGSYIQTGADVQAITNPDQTIVVINSYGVNKILSVTPSASTSFNTNDINWYIQNGAVIDVATALPFGGKALTDPTNISLIVNGTLNCNNYIISSSNGSTATFTLSPGGTLGIGSSTGIAATGGSGNIRMTNRIFSTQANYVYNGTSSQITGTGLPATVNSLTINNSSNSNTVSLTNSVTITSFHEIDKGIFSLGNNNVTLYSDANVTASFNKLGTGASINYSGTGRYIVERYINSGTGAGQHGKAWMFLSTPVNDVGLTVYNSWQESRSNITGYGTWITDPSGTANGFDAVSVSPSMKSYDPISDGWVGIPSTNIAISNPEGYFIYIRGDRTVTASVPDPKPTTLRIKGKLFTGNQPAITVPSNSFHSIGNPYASAVDFKKLYASSSNIDNTFYAWDPSVGGTYGAGAYQTVSGTTGYIAVPGGSGIYTTNTDYSGIQSGEAIMVYNSAGSSGSVNFTEDCKTTGSILVARQSTPLYKNQILFANLYTSSGVLADGNAVVFSNSFSNKLDKDDALKIANAGENFGIKRNSKNLAIEARSPVQIIDTVFYAINNLKRQGYRLLFVPQNMNIGLSAYLIDRYLKTEKEVSLTDSTSINLSITQDSASSSSGRFMIVFSANDALPVTFISVKAFRQNRYILVEWKVENEIGLKEYGVEHSTDGTHFSMIATIPALNISKATYQFPDNNPVIGNNYYRIRSLDMDGKIKYSAVVAIFNENIKSAISVYPNPLVNGKINLQFAGQPSGNYGIRLFNSAGQELFVKTINHPADNMSETIQLGGNLPHGIYQLEITGPGGEKQLIKVSR